MNSNNDDDYGYDLPLIVQLLSVHKPLHRNDKTDNLLIDFGEIEEIVDTNAAWLARLFFQHGFPLSRRTTVGDKLEALAAEIEHCSLTADIVIVNGGLGPTTDDLTAQAAAIAADSGLEQSDYWVQQMLAKYQKLGREMPQTNLKQAMLPEGAELLENPIGTACGFAMKLNRAWLYFTPGVPREFKKMAEEEILPRLKSKFDAIHALDCHRFYTFGLSESGIGQTLAPLNLPAGYEVGYRSSLPFIEVKLFTPRSDKQAISFQQKMIDLLGENVVSIDQELPQYVGKLLVTAEQNLTVTEYFTGGWLTNWLQDHPDSRSALLQGWMLPAEAESEMDASDSLSAALATASAAREKTGSHYALVSGSYHEEGVAVALATPEGDWAQVVKTKRRYEYRAHRNIVATVMLDMLRRYLTGKVVIGQYESLNCERETFLPADTRVG
ncbi:CinA family nicotinamide mononucleotide deamidase-related protein [Photobacterium sp. SDRW27]|uniref:CinA family nicotinamide mononucleotide deamidase-related protein n=1 Tax=Photobacterium obscurum TaxID=2829490 RepID=UPI002244F039|nr:CinA family nicotinamide mononucleotide deamidase-related protein [Photobacterium obscurum]MCW8327356.1 CinA family nicotinamide mononucleotide deamidase-related protein [Photobacterium obscurum]